MSTKIAPGGGGTSTLKRSVPILLATAVVLLSCIVLIPSTDETEAAPTIDITDVSVNSNGWSDLHSYTDIQRLKKDFSVTANVDGTSRILESDEFYLSLGGPLQNGVNTFYVIAYTQDGQDVVLDSYTDADMILNLDVDESYTLTSISATEPDTNSAYASTTEAEFRQINGMSVTATFTNSSGQTVTMPVTDYSLSWIYNEENQDSQGYTTVTVSYGGMTTTIQYYFQALLAETIKSIVPNSTFESRYTANDEHNKDKLTVTAVMNDGKVHVLDSDQFTVTGSTYAGWTENSVTSVNLTLTLIDDETQSSGFTVALNASALMGVSIDTDYIEFYAYDNPEDVSATVVYVSNFTSKADVTDGLSYYFYREVPSSSLNDLPSEDDGHIPIDELSADTYYLIVTFTENGDTVRSETYTVNVITNPIPYPTLENTANQSYNGGERSWPILYYNNIIEATITCSNHPEGGCQCAWLDKESNSLVATEVGTYTITFYIPSGLLDSYSWSTDPSYPTPDQSYTVTVSPGDATVTIGGLDDHTYGESWRPTFSATLNGTSINTDVTDDINWSLVTIEYRYGDRGNIVNSINRASAGDAEDWYVRVSWGSDATSNLNPGQSEWFAFHVAKDELTATADSVTYDGISHTPGFTVNGVYNSNVTDFTSDFSDSKADAGTYSIQLTLTDEGQTKYTWAAGNDTTVTIQWTITPAQITKPTLASEATVEYHADDQAWVVNDYLVDAMGSTVYCEYHSTIDNCVSFSNGTITARDVGKYTVTFSLNKNGNNTTNYVWNDGSFSNVYLTVEITQATLDLTVSVDDITYGDDAPEFFGLSSEDNDYTIDFNWLGSDGVGQLSAFSISTLYNPSDPAHRGAGDYTINVSLTSRNYVLGTVTGSLTVNPAELTISKVATDVDTYYGYAVPDKEDYTFTHTDVMYEGDWEAILDMITLSFDGYSAGSNVNQYTIAATCSGDADVLDNYTISIGDGNNGIVGTLEVLPIPVALTWETSNMEYNGGNAPSVEVAEVIRGVVGNTFTGYDISWASATGSDNPGDVDSFSSGEYILTLTLKDYGSYSTNYDWTSLHFPVTIEGDVLTILVTITDIQIELHLNDYTITYKEQTADTFLQWVMGNISADGVDLGSLETEIRNAMADPNSYSLTFTNSHGSWTDVYQLSADSYRLTVVLDNDDITNRYVYATCNITVSQAPTSINNIADIIGEHTYNNADQTVTVELPTSTDMTGSDVIEWEFQVPDKVTLISDDNNKAVFSVHDAGNFTIGFTVSADNYEVSVLNNDLNFVIEVAKANLTVNFGEDAKVDGDDVSYEGTYGGFSGTAPVLTYDLPVLKGVGGQDIDERHWVFTLGDATFTTWESLMAAVALPNIDGTAKTYEVEYQFQYDNYNDLSGTMTFTVNPSEISASMTVNGSEYDQSSQYGYTATDYRVGLNASGVDSPLQNLMWRITVYFTPYGSTSEQELETYDVSSFGLSLAGSYRIVYTASANYHDTASSQFDFTILPATITFSMDDFDGLVYTGDVFTQISGSASGEGTPDFRYEFIITGTETDNTAVSTTVNDWNALREALVNAGSYTVMCTVSADNHVTLGGVKFNVDIANTTLSVSPNLADSYTYSGETLNANGLFVLTSSAEYIATVQNPDWTFTVSVNGNTNTFDNLQNALDEMINAGEYVITYSVSAKNHNSVGPETVNLEITKAVLEFDEDRLAEIIGSGTVGENFISKIIYGDEAPSYSDLNSIVTGFVEGENFTSVFGNQNVTINYANGDGAGSTNHSGMQYTLNGTTLRSVNYNVGGLTSDFEVGKFAVTVTMDDNSSQYSILFEEELTYKYSTDLPFDDDIIENPRVVDENRTQVYVNSETVPRGEYIITADVSSVGSQNYIVTLVEGKFTVGKMIIGVTPSITGSVMFDGEELDNTTLLGFYTIESSIDIDDDEYVFTFEGHEAGWMPRDVDTYRVTISLDENSNYTFGDNPSATREISITHAVYDITLSLTDDSTVYNGQGHRFVLLSTSGGTSSSILTTTIMSSGIENEADLTVVYYVNGDPQEGIPVLTDAGTYTIRAELHGSPNFMLTQFQQDNIWSGWDDAVLEAKFTIDPYTIEEDDIIWTDDNFTYNGKDQSGYVQAWITDLADSHNVIYLELGEINFTHYNTDGYVFSIEGIQSGDVSANYELPESYDWTNTYHMQKMQVTIGIYDYTNDDTDDVHNGVTYGSPPEGGYAAYGWDDMISEDISSVYGACRENMITNAEAGTPDFSGYNLIDVLVPVVEYSDEYIAGGYDDYDIISISGDLFVNKRALHIIVNDQSIEYTGSPITVPNQNGDGTMYWHYSSASADIIEGDSLGIILTFDNVTPLDADTYENAIIAAFYNLDRYPDNNNYTIVMDQRGDFTVDPQRVTLVITPYSGYYTGEVVNFPYTGYTIRTSTGTLDRQITWGGFTYTLDGESVSEIRDEGTYAVHYTASLTNYALVNSLDDTQVNGGTFTVTILQAQNYWTSTDGTVTGWQESYEFGDYTYSGSPVLPSGSFTSHFSNDVVVEFYKVGENGDETYLGTLDDDEDPWEFTNVSGAGKYRVLVKVDGNENYADLETSYTVTIARYSLSVEWVEDVTYFSGNPVTNTLDNYDPSLMDWSIGDEIVNDDGTMTVDELGTYTVILTLLDSDNYQWEGRPDETAISCVWYVVDSAVDNHWDTVPSIRDWTYGDEMPSFTAGTATYGGDATVEFYLITDNGREKVTVPSDAGDYVMVSTVPGGQQEINGVTAAYQGLTQETQFTIHPYRVSIPDMESEEYTSEEIPIPYEDLTMTFHGSEVTVYTVTGDPGRDIGDYSATLALMDTNNFVWQDDTTEPKTVQWRIVSGGVPTYADFAVDTSNEVFTGDPITKNVICLRNGWTEGSDYTVTHTDNLNAGTATVTVSGTAVDAMTGESTPWSLTFTFEIVKATPVLDFVNEGFTSYEDNGTFELRPYLSDEAGLSDLVWTSSDESVATVDENGIVTLRGLGTAEITATLPGSENWNEAHDSYELTVNETQTEIVVVPGPGGSGGDGGVIYIPTVIREDAGISDMTWLIILACVVVVMLALIWLLWNRRTEGDGA